MITQYENRVTSSFLLWLDHTVLDKGDAYANFGSEFYPVNSLYEGYYTFGAPYKQFVSDESIHGADIPTGLYIDNVLTGTGVAPLVDINYEQGQGYFDSDVSASTISGNYSVKDFSVHLTNMAEQEVLFETKISMRNSTSQEVTGLEPNVNTYPAIFIKNNGGTNYPFAFGGEEVSAMEFRAIVLADSQFKLDAVCSILKDQARTNVAIFPDEKYPYNALGGLKNGVYNYTGIVSEISDNVFVNKVEVLRYNLGYMENLQNVNPNVFRAIIDFELEKPRFPRGE